MRNIPLGYGHEMIKFSADEDRFRVIARETSNLEPLSDSEVGKAFDSPTVGPPLEELINPGQSVLIVVSDATRATGSARIVNLLVRRLIQAGIGPMNIACIFATGIHRTVTFSEKQELLSPFITQRIRTIDHEANDESAMIDLGATQSGTPVKVNRALKDFDHVLIVSAISFHYFAGFTGGRKSICPGLAAADTVAATHMLALDFESGGRRTGVGTGLLDGNAVSEECERVARLIRPSFVINSFVDHRGRPVRIFAGHWREAHRMGCAEYLATHNFQIDRKRDLVIVSSGGSPYDINLIQAHKALDMAAYACEDGGTIVLLAQCRDGLGRSDFLKWFAEKDSASLELRLRSQYEVNGQTAWALLTKAERYRVVLVSDLDSNDVRSMRMIPAASLDDALSQIDLNGNGYIMPQGATWLPVQQY